MDSGHLKPKKHILAVFNANFQPGVFGRKGGESILLPCCQLSIVSSVLKTPTIKGKSWVPFKEYPRYIPTYTTYIWIIRWLYRAIWGNIGGTTARVHSQGYPTFPFETTKLRQCWTCKAPAEQRRSLPRSVRWNKPPKSETHQAKHLDVHLEVRING